jgi:hypothetical protein
VASIVNSFRFGKKTHLFEEANDFTQERVSAAIKEARDFNAANPEKPIIWTEHLSETAQMVVQDVVATENLSDAINIFQLPDIEKRMPEFLTACLPEMASQRAREDQALVNATKVYFDRKQWLYSQGDTMTGDRMTFFSTTARKYLKQAQFSHEDIDNKMRGEWGRRVAIAIVRMVGKEKTYESQVHTLAEKLDEANRLHGTTIAIYDVQRIINEHLGEYIKCQTTLDQTKIKGHTTMHAITAKDTTAAQTETVARDVEVHAIKTSMFGNAKGRPTQPHSQSPAERGNDRGRQDSRDRRSSHDRQGSRERKPQSG